MFDETLSTRLLTRAVECIEGTLRSGQHQMTQAITKAIITKRHAMIQAGTGTGKSLAYLAAVIGFVDQNLNTQAVIATATLALQSQLANKDIPIIMDAASKLGLPQISWCVLKGVTNYPCLLRIRQTPTDTQDVLVGFEDEEATDSQSELGQQVVGLRHWAEEQAEMSKIADRDDAPSHGPRAWAQISMSGRECIGPVCPYVGECFSQAAREQAACSQLVVTNHALVAIEASHGWNILNPDLLILDEAHELASRVTTSRSDELSPQMVDRVIRMANPLIDEDLKNQLAGVAQRFADAVETHRLDRVRDAETLDTVAELRGCLRQTMSAIGHDDPGREQVATAVKRVFEVSDRLVGADESEVIWVSMRPQYGAQLVVAPLRVADTIRDTILNHQTSIMTSATLKLGDSFIPMATTLGLTGLEEADLDYSAIDVGSPFDYGTQGICYVASHLPPPGRDGISEQAIDEIRLLVEAANGHTLGLFSSMRAAQRAAQALSDTDLEILLQGDAHLPDLISRFLDSAGSCLFGTISLWQGLDAPGDTCNLVIVDRIPFPRPDEPLLRARQDDVTSQGGNGFMQVAAAHAGLMLAQGTGRLIRSLDDKGVVAILDSRLLKAGYGPFLVKSMPPWWMTTDQHIVLEALSRLNPPDSSRTQGGEANSDRSDRNP